VNKLLTAIVATLMIAGGLSAISGATPIDPHNNIAIVGEGPSPLPMLPACDKSCSDVGLNLNQ
jgi:hypothetical protein